MTLHASRVGRQLLKFFPMRCGYVHCCIIHIRFQNRDIRQCVEYALRRREFISTSNSARKGPARERAQAPDQKNYNADDLVSQSSASTKVADEAHAYRTKET